jgi:hypothetical protein
MQYAGLSEICDRKADVHRIFWGTGKDSMSRARRNPRRQLASFLDSER